MFGLHTFWRKPRKFTYRPLYFDPEQEARDERRRQLLGDEAADEFAAESAAKEAAPGSYIRGRMTARRNLSTTDREKRTRAMQRRVIFLVLLVGIGLYFIFG